MARSKAKLHTGAFKEIPGTLWSVFLLRDGKPFLRVWLTAPTAEVAKSQAQYVVARHPRATLGEPEGVLLAYGKPALNVTDFTFIPKGVCHQKVRDGQALAKKRL